jgi:hypothetical protein
MTMNNKLREQMLSDPNFNLDLYARNRGFPSAAAMEAVLLAAVDVRTQGRVTDKTLAGVLKCYDPSMANQIRATAEKVNAVAEKHGSYHGEIALIHAVAGPDSVEAARELVGNLHDATIAEGIMAKRVSDDTPMRAQKHDPNSIRANLLREMSPRINKPATEVLADATEKVIARKEVLHAMPEAHTLREHIAVAVDDAIVSEQLESISDASALDDGFEAQP